MGGVDALDALVACYRITLRSKKYYLRFFFHFIDVAVVNGWLLYRRSCDYYGIARPRQNDLLSFKCKLAESLCKAGKDLQPTKKRRRPSLDAEVPQASRVRAPPVTRPQENIRSDKVGHWPNIGEKRQRCKNKFCNGKSVIFCVKCKKHFCA